MIYGNQPPKQYGPGRAGIMAGGREMKSIGGVGWEKNPDYTAPGQTKTREQLLAEQEEAIYKKKFPNIPLPEFPTLGGPGERENLLTGREGSGWGQLQREAKAAPGTSAWEKMAMSRQGTEEAQARDLAQKRGASAGQGIWSNLSMRGGVDTGARERAMTQGSRMGMQGLQDVARGGTMARADIGLEAEGHRRGLLSALPGMEFQRQTAGYDLAQRDAENKLKLFEIQKREQAAAKTADAIARAGKTTGYSPWGGGY